VEKVVKKFTLIILSSVLLSFLLSGCQQQESKEQNVKEANSNETQSLDVRQVVWNQLTNNDKKHIKGTWKDATVRKIVLKETMGNIKDNSYIGKQVYIVDYPSNDNPSLGGVAVYADEKSFKLIGYGYRE
jgi:hypothetical protein